MRHYPVTLLLSVMLSGPIWAQDVDPKEEAAAATESVDTTEEEPVDAEQDDDSDLDEQGYAGADDDDFKPSEDVQSDRSISFPTDI